jgi:hypothetical protein
MATTRSPRTPAEIAAIQARLQDLADHPGRVERMHGRHELDGILGLPQDSRHPTEPESIARFAADYGSVLEDQAVNYSSGLL